MDTFLSENVRDWCRGKIWWIYIPLLIGIVYVLIKYIQNPCYWNLLSNVDLLMHESGHFIFGFGGVLLMYFGGTLMQFLVPLVFVLSSWWKGEYAVVIFSLAWLGENLLNISTYIADASTRILPLLNGDADSHDWWNIFNMLNMMQYHTIIAQFVRFTGILCMLSAVIFGVLMVISMYKQRKVLSI